MHPVYFDNAAIPIDYDWKNIAISVSGGADSALLAYLICSLVKDHDITVHIINHVRCWKTKPWQEYNAGCVHKWLLQRFNNINFTRHTNFIAPELEYAVTGPTLTDEYNKKVSGDNIQQRSYAEYICHYHNIDAYYNGVTRNPRNVDFKGMAERDIELTADNQHLFMMRHMHCWALHPFRFIDKSWVLKQYKEHNIMDLFNITRSCEGTFADITYKTYIPGQEVPTCGDCFWCKERAWAIKNAE